MVCVNESIPIAPSVLELTSRRYDTGSKDARAFFIGFCGMTETKTAISINLGHRHAKAPLRYAEFQFFVDIFRNMIAHVDTLMSGKDANHNKVVDPREALWHMELPTDANVEQLSAEIEPEVVETSPFRLDDEYLDEDSESDEYGDE